jgi:hypothetical protein
MSCGQCIRFVGGLHASTFLSCISVEDERRRYKNVVSEFIRSRPRGRQLRRGLGVGRGANEFVGIILQ